MAGQVYAQTFSRHNLSVRCQRCHAQLDLTDIPRDYERTVLFAPAA